MFSGTPIALSLDMLATILYTAHRILARVAPMSRARYAVESWSTRASMRAILKGGAL